MSALDNLFELQEQICYVQCGFCATILLVSVPCNMMSLSMGPVITVRCGHCTAILSVDMVHKASPCGLLPFHHLFPPLNQRQQTVQPKRQTCAKETTAQKKAENTTCCRPAFCFSSDEDDQDGDDEDYCHHFNQVLRKPPEKKQRAPSAYNHFIKEEIKRLKIVYPNMTHKQAFSAAAKNWAHCPQSQYKDSGEVSLGYGEDDRKSTPVHSDEVHCCGNSTYQETKAMRQSISSKSPFY